MSDLYVALVHGPVYNKNMEVITSSVTNLDIHDIARCVRTYDVKTYYIVHPSPAQQDLTRRVMAFWQEGAGAEYNPDRREAFARVRLAVDLAQMYDDIDQERRAVDGEDGRACVERRKGVFQVATDARLYPNTIACGDLRVLLEKGNEAYVLVFGTGFGIIKEEMMRSDFILAPIYGPGDYNHLSVRSAVAVILDRLRGH